MRCSDADAQIVYLKTFQLPEDLQSQQLWIDRAEEDLFTAVILCRKRQVYVPLMNICYFLHQSIEKWLKLFLSIKGILAKGDKHHLDKLLQRAESLDSQFADVRSEIDAIDPQILGPNFASSTLRYGETLTEREIKSDIKALMKAAFKTRRLVKQCLVREAV